MFRAKNSSGNGEVDVQEVEKIAPVYNLVIMCGMMVKPAATSVAAGFAGSNNNRQPPATNLLQGGAVTKELINKYIEDRKRQLRDE